MPRIKKRKSRDSTGSVGAASLDDDDSGGRAAASSSSSSSGASSSSSSSSSSMAVDTQRALLRPTRIKKANTWRFHDQVDEQDEAPPQPIEPSVTDVESDTDDAVHGQGEDEIGKDSDDEDERRRELVLDCQNGGNAFIKNPSA